MLSLLKARDKIVPQTKVTCTILEPNYIGATYQIINFLGWKPDPSQQKPMERGTGEFHLKDLHRIDQIIKQKKEQESGNRKD